jgi:hypothetical protein
MFVKKVFFMKKTLLSILAALSLSSFMSGCGQTIPYINENSEGECATLNKELLEVDEFITTVKSKSAFHLEEAALAYDKPKITHSNNKSQMLRDAEKKRDSIVDKQTKLGCDAPVK